MGLFLKGRKAMSRKIDEQTREAECQYVRTCVRLREASRPGERRYWRVRQKEEELRLFRLLRERIVRVAAGVDSGN